MQPEKVTKPKREKTPEEALSTLMRLCARAERSQGDARRLLRGWGIREAEAERIVGRLVRERFIDDTRYAEAFVRTKLRRGRWGAHKARPALRRKQDAPGTIGAALAQSSPAERAERLLAQLRRKARTLRYATPYELKTKLIRYGLSLGYEFEAVAEAAASLVTDCDTCDESF